MNKSYFHAIAILIGTTVGVGIFAIPYVISKSGIISLFIYMPLLGLVQYFLHLLYAEIVLSTKTKHRIPGYAEKYLNIRGKMFASIVSIVGAHGSILAYIILGGIFFHALLGDVFGGSILFYATVLFILESLIVLVGLRLIANVELIMVGMLIAVVALVAFRGWGSIDLANYDLINWKNIFLPYGPIFFAVSGLTAIPEICRLLAQKKEKIKSAIFFGTLIPVIITLIFVTVIIGITGARTTPDTLVGLNLILGDGVVRFALIFGLLSIITSFLVITQALREVYWWDFKMNKTASWALACGTPYLLYLIGLQNLTTVVSLTGAIVGSLVGIILILLALKIKKKKEQESVIINKINKPIAFALSLLFALGLVYTVWNVIINS